MTVRLTLRLARIAMKLPLPRPLRDHYTAIVWISLWEHAANRRVIRPRLKHFLGIEPLTRLLPREIEPAWAGIHRYRSDHLAGLRGPLDPETFDCTHVVEAGADTLEKFNRLLGCNDNKRY
ncbi:hypothetical protein ATO13_22166 [Stappia sp. 22II-S9-Z10]|nr:hypothetical protein ATO13_22166 [Stappia sp. 22II-S9-Z10]